AGWFGRSVYHIKHFNWCQRGDGICHV
ncbi:Os04g0353000, partial [Oryza sativa Japonica Group]